MEHDLIQSKILIKDYRLCDECPLRLNNKDKHINFGIGYSFAKTVIILPYHNINNNKAKVDFIDIIKKAYKQIKGDDIILHFYVTCLPKCYDKELFLYEPDEQATKVCSEVLFWELVHLCNQFNRIVVCGKNLSFIEDAFDETDVRIISTPFKYIHEPDKFVKELEIALFYNREDYDKIMGI